MAESVGVPGSHREPYRYDPPPRRHRAATPPIEHAPPLLAESRQEVPPRERKLTPNKRLKPSSHETGSSADVSHLESEADLHEGHSRGQEIDMVNNRHTIRIPGSGTSEIKEYVTSTPLDYTSVPGHPLRIVGEKAIRHMYKKELLKKGIIGPCDRLMRSLSGEEKKAAVRRRLVPNSDLNDGERRALELPTPKVSANDLSALPRYVFSINSVHNSFKGPQSGSLKGGTHVELKDGTHDPDPPETGASIFNTDTIDTRPKLGLSEPILYISDRQKAIKSTADDHHQHQNDASRHRAKPLHSFLPGYREFPSHPQTNHKKKSGPNSYDPIRTGRFEAEPKTNANIRRRDNMSAIRRRAMNDHLMREKRDASQKPISIRRGEGFDSNVRNDSRNMASLMDTRSNLPDAVTSHFGLEKFDNVDPVISSKRFSGSSKGPISTMSAQLAIDCELCDEMLPVLGEEPYAQLLTHLRVIHNFQRHMCVTCGAKFGTEGEVRNHHSQEHWSSPNEPRNAPARLYNTYTISQDTTTVATCQSKTRLCAVQDREIQLREMVQQPKLSHGSRLDLGWMSQVDSISRPYHLVIKNEHRLSNVRASK
ncbi:hypothetical protein BU24DRAFT_446049 [Aaosphaeria arxii CBS 175.79]|uniref:C2H2-type domain-containing protein n=1 Tax=Aaosphaeria arxii CBS 175.79 TaxID=1450172 RepID=A0A6A5Y6L6_9PLEO|nr:uncharacterized protein BU24DRAFT_446049 [Aaosphaeria arxii CBS 175.79]KAF2020926.1 hypothetical protein BU24DRAFT_446049 [Aaosphaeria arxii CBS 175.79]